MSPTTDNFIHSLVEMSKAFEELPTVKEQFEQANARWLEGQDHIQRLEERIQQVKAELEASHEARRKVEAERDDAELRFLELDDKLAMVRRNATGLQDILAKQMELTAEPPKPQPEPEPKHEPQPETGYVADAPQQGQSDYTPTVPSSTNDGGGTTGEASMHSSLEVPKSDANPPTPTVSSTDGDGHSPSTATPTPTAQPIDGASSQAQPTTQPYAGKRYYDHPTYLTREAWHAGGGTDADYDWRPGRSVGF